MPNDAKFCLKCGYSVETSVKRTNFDEREMFHWELKEASVHDHILRGGVTCVITNRRILLTSKKGESVQVLLSEIESVKPKSMFEILGVHYWAAIYTGGNTLNDWGNVLLYTLSKEDSKSWFLK